MGPDEQRDKQPGRKQAEEKRQRRHAESSEVAGSLGEENAQCLEVCGRDQAGRCRGGLEQPAKSSVSAESASSSALKRGQRLFFPGQSILVIGVCLVGKFQLRIPVAAGLQQLLLHLIDLASFTALEELESAFFGRGMGPSDSGFAPITTEFELRFPGLKQSLQLEDRSGEALLQFLDFIVDLPIQPRGAQTELPFQLVRADGAALDNRSQSVEELERIVQTQRATHSRS